MLNKKVLVTGAGGLIGSQAVEYFSQRGCSVVGIDNDMRAYFFGKEGSVAWNIARLKKLCPTFTCHNLNIRSKEEMDNLFSKEQFDLIVHSAAQPSHDWAAKEPITDFSVNAQGTLILLETMRQYAARAVFILLSTNKVYGDRPNSLPFIENETRYDLPQTHENYNGIDEKMSVDQCKHSLFGVSKLSADLLTQEYGRYFGLKTTTLRGGCLTGSCHAGVELHGFLSYLVKSIVHEKPYTIFGYKGKQVRDNIHAYDVCTAIDAIFQKPKSGALYNIGGTRFSNVSVLEAIEKIERLSGKKAQIRIEPENRIGDHQWYITDMTKFNNDYPQWKITKGIDEILEEMVRFELEAPS